MEELRGAGMKVGHAWKLRSMLPGFIAEYPARGLTSSDCNVFIAVS